LKERVLAVDIGGTKVSVAAIDIEGRIRAQKKFLVENSSPIALARAIARQIPPGASEAAAAGVVVPGIVYAETGNVWAPNLWGHKQVSFRSELEEALGLPVTLDSDRAGSAFGEQWLGAARGLRDVVFLAVGTGIGAGIISGGHLLRGTGDVAGAVGWFALAVEHCERYREVGCWEAEAAGPALARRSGVATAEEAIRRARAGDSEAQNAVAETARYLGLGIANLISVFNPEIVILGGGLMKAHDLFIDGIRNTVYQWAQPVAARQMRIEPSRLGEHAALLGAARLAFDFLKERHVGNEILRKDHGTSDKDS
jgi:glucokinase